MSRKPFYLLIFFISQVVILNAFMTACGESNGGKIKVGNSGKDTLDVALIYGPGSYYLYDDTLGGINYDLLRMFESQTGQKLKFWPVIDLESALEGIENQTFDLLASLPVDYDLKQRFQTTENIFFDRLVLIQKDSPFGKKNISSAIELGGDTVYVVSGSPAINRISNLSKEIGERIEVIALNDVSDEYLCMKVGENEIRLAVVNEKIASAMHQTYPDLSYNNPVSFTQLQVWLTSKEDTATIRQISNWFEDFRQTDDYRQIIKKY